MEIFFVDEWLAPDILSIVIVYTIRFTYKWSPTDRKSTGGNWRKATNRHSYPDDVLVNLFFTIQTMYRGGESKSE